MNLSKRLDAFVELGNKLANNKSSDLSTLAISAKAANGWFVESEVERAIDGIIKMLSGRQLNKWVQDYSLDSKNPKNVGVVMAGNIPFVGFHDMLCVLLAGHNLHAKLSSQDKILMDYLITTLKSIAPAFQINLPEKLKEVDAIIATGSDNSARYFEYYFRNKPNIIRKNRTSVAVITGNESEEDLQLLANDVFSYYGLGCRNVSKIYCPEGYDLTVILKNFESYSEIANHSKYRNNYDYNKSLLLVNGVEHLDNGFLLLQESEAMVSPISVLFRESYRNQDELEEKIQTNSEKIQCIVSGNSHSLKTNNVVNFGEAQQPNVWDYADGVDTLDFLTKL